MSDVIYKDDRYVDTELCRVFFKSLFVRQLKKIQNSEPMVTCQISKCVSPSESLHKHAVFIAGLNFNLLTNRYLKEAYIGLQ